MDIKTIQLIKKDSKSPTKEPRKRTKGIKVRLKPQ
jgi:hypothetical protein